MMVCELVEHKAFIWGWLGGRIGVGVGAIKGLVVGGYVVSLGRLMLDEFDEM